MRWKLISRQINDIQLTEYIVQLDEMFVQNSVEILYTNKLCPQSRMCNCCYKYAKLSANIFIKIVVIVNLIS